MRVRKDQKETEQHTVRPHDALQRVQVLHVRLVPAEDLGSGTEIVGEVFSVLIPHFFITTQLVDLVVERNVVGRPVTFGKRRERETLHMKQRPEKNRIKRRVVTSAQRLRLVGVLHQPRDLLHHRQSAVINTEAQLHSAPVQHHVLVVVGAYTTEPELSSLVGYKFVMK